MTTPALSAYTLERPGCRIHYWLAGPAHRPLLVLTHGATIDHSEFDLLVPLLAERYRVLIWDVRAHGLSRPTSEPFTIQRVVDDLIALLDLLGYSQATLIGHSMGGNIGQEVAFQHPERIQALVMLGCTCNTLKLSPLEALTLKLIGPLLHLYPYSLLKRQGAENSSIKPEVQSYLYERFSQLPKAEFCAILLATIQCLHYEPGYRIEHSLLLMHGDRDRTGNIRKIAPVWAARDLHCRYVIIPNAGHAANLDNPPFFHQVLLDFLAEQVEVGL